MISALGSALRTKGRQLNPEPWSMAIALAALGLGGYAVYRITRPTPTLPETFTEGYESTYYWTIDKQADDPNWIWSVYSIEADPMSLIYRGTAATFQAALDAKDAYVIALDKGGYKP